MSRTLEAQLIAAAEAWDLKAVKQALHAGADIHALDDYALRLAAKNGHTEMVAILIQAGADLTALLQSDLNKKQLTAILQQYAATATRGFETVMLLDTDTRLMVLRHLHPELKQKQIMSDLDMFHALDLDAAQMGALWASTRMNTGPAKPTFFQSVNLFVRHCF